MVTGAAGFIGSHFVDYVLENHPEDQVIGFDCLTYAGNMNNLDLALLNKRFEFVKGDIRNPSEVDSVVSRVDAIVNFAAETHVDRSIASSSEFVSTNVIGVNTLLESALKNEIRIFHQISTDEVYGSVITGLSSEDAKLEPRSPYAVSKAAADLLVISFGVTHNLNYKITRASNNFGPRQFPEKLIPFFVQELFNLNQVPLYGSGENIRDWLFVSDHVRGVDQVFRSNYVNEIFNLGGDNLRTNLEITELIIATLGLDHTFISFVSDRKGHDFRYAINSSKARMRVNYKPNSDFHLALKETIRWQLSLLSDGEN